MPVIPGVMELRYVLNDGAAFSMLADAEWGRVFLIVVTGLALAALAVYFFWKKPSSWLERWAAILPWPRAARWNQPDGIWTR